MPAAPSRAAPDPPDLVAERGMPALADGTLEAVTAV